MQLAIRDAYPRSEFDTAVETFPADQEVDGAAYLRAFDAMSPGDAVTVFTPDDTHFEIAMAAVERGLHVLLTKPLVKTLDEHYRLFEAARRRNVLVRGDRLRAVPMPRVESGLTMNRRPGDQVMCEVHKRWDPMYADARDRIQVGAAPVLAGRGGALTVACGQSELGEFSHLSSYMSQPKHQLQTFKSWAGRASDISYYLNSHHIDFHEVSVTTPCWVLVR